MQIKTRLLLSILPPIIILFIGSSTFLLLTTQDGINQIEQDFLQFKAIQLENYIINQWNLLVEFQLYDQKNLIKIAHATVENYAKSIIDTDTQGQNQEQQSEVIFALVNDGGVAHGSVVINTNPTLTLSEEQSENLLADEATTFAITNIGDYRRAYTSFQFDNFNWTVFVANNVEAFNQTGTTIQIVTIITLIIAVILMTVIVLVLAHSINKPLRKMLTTAEVLIQNAPEINERLPYHYNDESGHLAYTLNTLFTALDNTYQNLKKYTFNSIIAQRKESRIRTIFQKYVPQELVNRLSKNPHTLISGETRHVAILVSDIRNFSKLSESLHPEKLVNLLNTFYTYLVAEITKEGGIIDKYMGDALMAVFGAPVQHDDDKQRAVRAAINMQKALKRFNAWQRKQNEAELVIGIAIHFGNVVVGNIGTDAKIEYTVIGDTVNLAFRLEGLCKIYHETVITSKIVAEQVRHTICTRFIDRVVVKGKSHTTDVYAIRGSCTQQEQTAFSHYHSGIACYYQKKFVEAESYFKKTLTLLADDHLSKLFLDRCAKLKEMHLPKNWNGARDIEQK